MQKKFLVTAVIKSKKTGTAYLVGLLYNADANAWKGYYNRISGSESNILIEITDDQYALYSDLVSEPAVISVERYVDESDHISYRIKE